MSLFQEMKRRNVIRVAIAYAVVAWLVLQVADVVLNNVAAPGWVFFVVLLLLAIGFIVVVVFSWVFEMTPEGLKRESEVRREESITGVTGKKLDRLITAVLVLALGYFAIDKFLLSAQREQAAVEAALEGAEPVERSPAPARKEPERSIAVLPFVNMSADPEQEYFSDGLSEELLNLLAKVPDLQVAARTSAFSFKNKDVTIAEVARELAVANVLEGSVRSAGDRIRVTAQLVRADNGFHLWSETYDRTLDDVFAIQDEIAGAVVDALKVTLLGEAPHASETTPEAYALYLQARHLSNQLTPENFAKALAMYQRVIDADPDYAPAWAGLSRNYRNMRVTGQLDDDEAFQKAMEAVDRALELDPTLAEAHARKGLLQMENALDYSAAARSYRRALELNPNDPSAQLGVADLYAMVGATDHAIELGEAAIERDPVDPLGYFRLGGFYWDAGRLDEARSMLENALNLSPDMYAGNYRLGLLHLIEGRVDEAAAAFAADTDGEYRLKGAALVANARGNEAEFEALFSDLRAEYGDVWPSEIAHVYAWIGDADAAFEWLDRAVAIGEGGLTTSASNVLMKSLNTDARWQPYLAAVGAGEEQLAEIRAELD
jgi:TolB-like protein